MPKDKEDILQTPDVFGGEKELLIEMIRATNYHPVEDITKASTRYTEICHESLQILTQYFMSF